MNQKKKYLFTILLMSFAILYSQNILEEITPKFYGLSQDVTEMSEITYTYNEQNQNGEKYQERKLIFSKGKLQSDRNEFFGEYASVNETKYIYNSKGQLIKKIYTDANSEKPAVTLYEYKNDLLKKDIYENEFSKAYNLYDYDSKKRLIKITSTDENQLVTNIVEYYDFGDNPNTFTKKDVYFSEKTISSTGIAQYENGFLVLDEYESDYLDKTQTKYENDNLGNPLSVYYNDELTGYYQYEYVGDNFVKKYYREDFGFFKLENFVFRMIQLSNGKKVGSTEPEINFILQHNVIDEELPVDSLKEGCNAGDCENGYGIFNFNNGEQYEGYYQDSKRNGPGIMMYEDGSSFNGMWKNDEKNGLGFYSDAAGNVFFGYYKFNLRDGYGYEQINNENGIEFNPSLWEAGNKIKKVEFVNNNVSTGCISGDCNNGFGNYLYDNGDVYIGYFNEGNYDKMGMYVYKIGDVFIGEFRNHKKSGYGMYIWENGSVYYGEYLNDNYQGLGAYIPKNNESKLIGEFKEGQLVKSFNPE